PRDVLGYGVQLLSTLERRLELLAALGGEDALVVEVTPEGAATSAQAFAQSHVLGLGAEGVGAGEGFRFGERRGGDLGVFERLGAEVHETPLVPGVSSRAIRDLVIAGDVRGAARPLGRPVEVEGIVVSGDARGGTLGFPTANLRVDRAVLVPHYGIYAGAGLEHRAAVSIGVNPHYGRGGGLGRARLPGVAGGA